MGDDELKEAIVGYVKRHHRRNERTPSVRTICKHFRKENLNITRFYKIFPGRFPEVCRLAGVPIPKERIGRTKKATKILRGKRQAEEDLTEVEDPEIKKNLAEKRRWKKRGNKVRVLLAAKKEAQKEKLNTLKLEAELNPKNIPAYLKALNSPALKRVLNDMCEACRLEKISVGMGCVKAVKEYGPKLYGKKKSFEDRVEFCLREWASYTRIMNAAIEYSQIPYDCLCSKCNVKLEYFSVAPIDTFQCPRCRKGSGYYCPVCKKVSGLRTWLRYDPKTNSLECPHESCMCWIPVTPPVMKKTGTLVKEEFEQIISRTDEERRRRNNAGYDPMRSS